MYRLLSITKVNWQRLEERVKANLEEVAKAQEDFARLQEQRKQVRTSIEVVRHNHDV